MSTPRSQSASMSRTYTNASQSYMDSPLKNPSFPGDIEKAEFEGTLARSLQMPSDTALESEAEDEDTIHVDAPDHRISKIYGGAAMADSTENLGPYGGNTEDEGGFIDERGYGVPILASDEVAKEPTAWELQPAVSPVHERRESFYADYHHRTSSATSSRPVSVHDVPGIRNSDYDREAHSTPLEDLEEYEPLFPEEDKAAGSRPMTAADKLKQRPDLKNRKFPSQDVWEDTPTSLQYTATVSTPQLPEDNDDRPLTSHLKARDDETPEQAFARRQEELAELESRNPASFLNPTPQPREATPQDAKPWSHQPHLAAETRPSSLTKQRFPSRDVWEDNPDSLQLTTTVAGPQSEEEKEILSPPDDRPTTGAVVFSQEKAAAGLEMDDGEGRATTGIAAALKPEIPVRPARAEKPHPVLPDRPAQRQTQVAAADVPLPPTPSGNSSPVARNEAAPTVTKPTIPDRPKPHIPARPAKPVTQNSSEGVPLTKTTSASSAKSVGSDTGATTKAKPPVPSRPIGSKIAALQGGFMSDLNKRLQLGPQAPKKEDPVTAEKEEEKEKAPLADARKGRARGPARRAPAKSPAPAVGQTSNAPSTISLFTPSTLWQIYPEDGTVNVASSKSGDVVISSPVETKAVQSSTPTLATNMAGEDLHEPSEIALGAETSSSRPSALEDAQSRESEHKRKDDLLAGLDNQRSSPTKDSEDPSVARQNADIEDEDMTASTATLKPHNETVDQSIQTGEHVIQTSAPSTDGSAPEGVKERLIAYLGGQAPQEGDVVVRESVPGSFE